MAYEDARQRVVLFGGEDVGRVLGDTWEWDGTEWTQIADTGPSGRLLPGMVFDSSRACLVLFGGEDPGVGRLGDSWEWNDDAGWVERQDMGPREIDSPKMASTGEHMVLFGALYAGDDAWGRTREWEGQLWTQRQDMGPPRRQWYDLAYDSQRDRVVLFGGWDNGSGTSFGDTWGLAIMEQ